MKYAPILIPTLCRHEHFRNCVESLLANTGADLTDLYIALDYPAKSSHFEGYKLINDFINEIVGFKSVNIIRRESNFGALPNFYRGMDEVLAKYDSFIYIEDDLVFSPNFLEFTNKGLNKFKDDKTIFAVSGHTYNGQEIKFSDNNYYRQGISLPVHGFGIWKDRIEAFKEIYTRSFAIKKIMNPFSFYKILRHSASTFLFLLVTMFKKEIFSDSAGSIYMFFEKKEVIQPTLSKVKNMGWDGTGNNCKIDENQAFQEIDSNYHFNYTGNGKNYYEINNKLLLEGMRNYMSYSKMFGHVFRMILHRIKTILK